MYIINKNNTLHSTRLVNLWYLEQGFEIPLSLLILAIRALIGKESQKSLPVNLKSEISRRLKKLQFRTFGIKMVQAKAKRTPKHVFPLRT